MAGINEAFYYIGSLPSTADFSAPHFKSQPQFQLQNCHKKQTGTTDSLFNDTNTAAQEIAKKQRNPMQKWRNWGGIEGSSPNKFTELPHQH